MNIKSLPKKIGNDLKADANAIFHALDIASDGSLSLIKESIVKSYQGFLDAKFNNLILDMANNNIKTDELLNFINSSSHSDREFMSSLIIKNLHADNCITIFILAKLWENKIKNGSLNYYESSLFTNINTFTHEDFEIYYYAIQHMIQPEKTNMAPYILVPLENEYYILAMNKFCSFGILQTAYTADGSYYKEENKIYIFFFKTPYSDTLYQILDEYFKNTPPS
ncbi:hypothetical protein [Sulfurospirillum multivorans]|uniref:Uncharacterized protein n=2 Tax=Sulfurospirillum multivorans TaxID=66821 RepID=A0AA86AQU9_SULMK|nr:hypothetical protein [Sulfurospirillum multivorans]AHJ14051.1 hypothetical protein SMUL_2813 [Sulfurospirillum multivorans DSM 12446]QEH07538.1 hypothetical protein SMN_2783 [Sulfurospirillum multivorans]